MRGKKASRRSTKPDLRYNNPFIGKFINYVMRDGKKSIAQEVVYQCLDIVKEKTKKNPIEIFDKAMKNVSPLLEVRSKRVGGANYQIPVQVRSERRFILGSRWIIEAAQTRKGKSMQEKLAEELMAAANLEGSAMRKKQNVQKMAEANRAFAHFAR
ncbi:MAG: 30S ribosomal protein S7 [Parcubacteria group bacterium]|nr:30S ribosomal protein S7 [Parcubacteria group bacterium]